MGSEEKASTSAPTYTIGEITLLAYMAFKRPKNARYTRLVPKDPAAWLEFQLQLVKKKQKFPHLSDK